MAAIAPNAGNCGTNQQFIQFGEGYIQHTVVPKSAAGWQLSIARAGSDPQPLCI